MAERVHHVVQAALASVALLVALAVGHLVLAAAGVVATAHVYDAPAFERSDAQDATSAEGLFSVALAGDNVAAMPAASAGDAATTPVLLTSTPRTAGGLADAASGARLNARLTADEIASGHSYTKHVVQRGEFPGIRTRTQFADMVENVINNYDDVRHLSGGRTAYWRDGVVVIRNPRAPDGGTAFVPRDGYDYFLGLG